MNASKFSKNITDNSDLISMCQGGKTTKVDRYKWSVKDSPGQMRMIKKTDLVIDHTYQRNANEAKIMKIVKDWSWVACGVISVADRDGLLYVIDGQHRVLGAMRRADIAEMPCMVFKTSSAKEEAEGFLVTQTMRKAVTGVEKFKALIVTEYAPALVVEQLITSIGRTASKNLGTTTITCIALLIKLATLNKDLLIRIWPLIGEISKGKNIGEKLIDGLFYIESNMVDGESISDKLWSKRIEKVGIDELNLGAQRAAAFYVRGGSKVWAMGMMESINRGLHNKLQLISK
jgi:hypothetical protein